MKNRPKTSRITRRGITIEDLWQKHIKKSEIQNPVEMKKSQLELIVLLQKQNPKELIITMNSYSFKFICCSSIIFPHRNSTGNTQGGPGTLTEIIKELIRRKASPVSIISPKV